jgi:hypothetical protein
MIAISDTDRFFALRFLRLIIVLGCTFPRQQLGCLTEKLAYSRLA